MKNRQWLRSLLYAVAFTGVALANVPHDTAAWASCLMCFAGGSFAAFAFAEFLDPQEG